MDSLQHYLLVSQDTMEIEMYTRNADDIWRLTSHQTIDEIWIDAIGCRLKWDEVYARVSFESNTGEVK
jgi:Uma2 family endonuclease